MPPRRIVIGLCAALAMAALPKASADSGEWNARVIWQGLEVNVLGAPSRDGRWLSYADPRTGDLAVREVATGRVRFVTRKDPKTQAGEFAYFSVISPDGKTVAFAWQNGEGFYDLRVGNIPPEGAHPTARVLYSNREAGFVQPCAFSPDGKYILTLLFRRDNISQIALVSVEDGQTRTLKSLNWIYPKRMDFSPDGRWIVYDNLSEEGAAERDLFVLAVDGSGEKRLLEGPANDVAPLWSPDGREVLYVCDRFGSTGICAVSVDNGRAIGEPRLLRGGVGRALPLGVTAGGQLYYGVRAGQTDTYITQLGSTQLPPPLALDTPGLNSGAVFSPDGSTLAYLSLRGAENYGLAHRAVMLYSLAGKSSRELPVKLAHIEKLAWSPDSRRLLLAGSDRRARGGLFEYDLESGQTSAVLLTPENGHTGPEAIYALWENHPNIIYIRPGSPWTIVLLDPADKSRRVLYEAPMDIKLTALAVSPDGRWMGFGQIEPSGDERAAVFLLALDSRETKKLLTLPSGRLTDLAWMPGGKALLVGTEGASGAHLWLVSAAGDSMQPALRAPNRQPGVSIHPDGKLLAITNGKTEHQIWVLEYASHPESAPPN